MRTFPNFEQRMGVLLLASCMVVHAQSQWSNDPTENSLVCGAVEDQLYPIIISDSSGGAIICWEDLRNTNVDINIYAQRVDSNGVIQWTADGVTICDAPDYQSNPSMVPDGAGGAFITWQDHRYTAQYPHIYAQRIDPAGNVLWATNGVPICTDTAGQYNPVILADGIGGAFIVWNDFREGGPNSDVYAQRIDASGAPQWITNGIQVCNPPGEEVDITLVSDGAGGAIITWNDSRLGNSMRTVYAQRIDPAGVTQWPTNGVSICGEPGAGQPRSESDGSGGAIITWADNRSVTEYHIYAQRVDGAGDVQWMLDGVPICLAQYSRSHPNITTDANGGAIITWEDLRMGAFNMDIYAQRVDPNGAVQWTIDGVAVCAANGNQVMPTLVPDEAGGAVITWGDKRGGGVFGDIYAQKINAAGVVQWTLDGVAISTAASDQTPPTIATDMAGGAVITWSDKRSNTAYDIYTQLVSNNGALGFATGIDETAPMTTLDLFPNPATDRITVRLDGTATTEMTLGLYDATGRMITSIAVRKGTVLAYMDVRSVAPGTYTVRPTTGARPAVRQVVIAR